MERSSPESDLIGESILGGALAQTHEQQYGGEDSESPDLPAVAGSWE